MQKITTLFKKDPNDLSRVTTEIDPENAWALTVGIPTRKYDGTACAIIDGVLYKRYDCKRGKQPPEGAIPCQAPDPITGHWPHWVKCKGNDPSNKFHFEALDNMTLLLDGTYELVGPRINGNKDHFPVHTLVKHGRDIIMDSIGSDKHKIFKGYDDIREFLSGKMIEGIVFHNPETGQMCKIRRKDFGFPW